MCQQLKINTDLYHWIAENATAEIDFVIQQQNQIIPIEVEAEENLKSKSLATYAQKYAPTTAVRTSMNQFRNETWFTNWLLYAVSELVM